jgi:hypothetical protein
MAVWHSAVDLHGSGRSESGALEIGQSNADTTVAAAKVKDVYGIDAVFCCRWLCLCGTSFASARKDPMFRVTWGWLCFSVDESLAECVIHSKLREIQEKRGRVTDVVVSMLVGRADDENCGSLAVVKRLIRYIKKDARKVRFSSFRLSFVSMTVTFGTFSARLRSMTKFGQRVWGMVIHWLLF